MPKMTETTAASANFEGLSVVTFESRRGREMATLISRFGGVPRVAPALREVPLEENVAAFEFGEALLAGRIDAIVFMTGVGTRRLFEVLETRHSRESIVDALSLEVVIARGPKPSKVLREYLVPISISVPEPNTWREILAEMDRNPGGFEFEGSRIAIQEYGVPNEEFLAALEKRGARVMRVPVYQWALPLDLEPLRDATRAIIEGDAQILLFTSATQVDHLLSVAESDGVKDQLLKALAKAVVASVGPTCSERLAAHGIAVDLEPQHPKMGPLVQEAALRAKEVMKHKQSDGKGRKSGATAEGPASTVYGRSSENAAPWRDSRFMRACRFEVVDATPIWLMRQAGRYMKDYRELRARVPFLDLCKNPQLVSEVTVTAAEKLGVDAAIIFADLLLIVEPLGLQLEYGKGEGPIITPALRSASDIDRLAEVTPEQSLAYFYDGIRQTRKDLNPKLPLLGFAGCPFTLASYLIEGGGSRNYRYTKALMYSDPGAWRALMEHLARNLARYINAQIDAGVQAIQIFDTWVGCLGPADYIEYVQPYTRMMLEAVKPGTPIIHFGTGTAMLLEAMRDAGGDIIGVDAHVEIDAAWKRLGGRVGVQGNLDSVVLYSDQNFIRARAKRVLDQVAYRRGHIFNLGHGLLPDTPYDNVVALVKMVHDISSEALAKGAAPDAG
jgi:uroporphyrinogen decarboxylase